MKEKRWRWDFVFLAIMLIATNVQVSRLASTVESLARQLERNSIVMAGTLHHEFVSGGVVYPVDTVRGDTETKAAWRARHLADIQAAWALHPPD